MASIYWAARDLAGFFIGNHHFIIIGLSRKENLLKTKAIREKGKRFVTLGGFEDKMGNLRFYANQKSDVQSVMEVLTPSKAGTWSDFDLEHHRIKTLAGGGFSLAVKLEQYAYTYNRNIVKRPVKYNLVCKNCSAWVNSIFKVAGVSKSERIRLGEFKGVDWGEEDLVPLNLFK